MAADEEANKAFKRVKSDVRSVLLSAPRGVLKRNFRKEFMSLVGQDVPLNKLGFKTMDEFVRACPDVVQESIGPTGEPTYYVVANAETQHVASLVARQKKPRLKVLKKATPVQRVTPLKNSWNKKPAPRPTPSRYRKLVGNKLFRSSLSRIGPGPVKVYSKTTFLPAGSEGRTAHLPTRQNESSSAGIPPWKDELKDAVYISSVSDLIQSQGRHKDKMVCISGYPGHQDRIQQYNGQFRILLFNDYNPHFKSRPLMTPVLNVFFMDKFWNLKKYCDPYSLDPRGSNKIKVWGLLTYKFWEKKGDYTYSLKAVYYERISSSSSSSQYPSSLSTSSFSRSTHMREQEDLRHTISGQSFKPIRVVSYSNAPARSVSVSSMNSSPESSLDRGCSTAGGMGEWLKRFLRDKPHGLWAKVVMTQYKKDFGTEAPSDMLTLVSEMPFIKVEEAVPDNPILYYVQDKTPPLPVCVEPPLSDSEWIDVLVVSVTTPQCFYVQLLGEHHSQALEALSEEMRGHFETNRTPDSIKVSSVSKDALYAVCWSDSDEWCRAVVLSVPDPQSNVLVRYPDYGNQEVIPVSSLHQLPSKFYSLPFQGIRCALVDFNDKSDKAGELFEDLVFEKSCSMLVTQRSRDVYLVDLIPPDKDKSVTDQISSQLNPVEALVPRLPEVGSGCVPVRLVEVSSDEPGYVYIHVLGHGTKKLEELINDVNDHYKNKPPSSRDRLTKNRLTEGLICCARYEDDDEWHRARVISISPSASKVKIEYIDYGTQEEHEPSRLKRAREEHPLNALPPQALKCKLHGLPSRKGYSLSDSVIECLLQYMEYDQLHLEMVTEMECILYDELEQNINEILIQKERSEPNQLSNHDVESPGSNVSHIQLDSNADGASVATPTLPAAEDIYCTVEEETLNFESLPGGDEIVTVLVSYCASSDEFTVMHVQLCSQYSKLVELQEELQAYCSGSPPSLPLYKEGMVGVARYHSDGLWYRVILKDTFQLRFEGDKMLQEVPVLFVDYGNEEHVTDVVMMTKQLLNRLPFQAIPVQLSGLSAMGNFKAFEEMVLDKQFYCHRKGFDSITNSYIVSLMDCKTHKLVSQVLSEENG